MTIHTVFTIHAADPDHLQSVSAAMQTLGAPQIRVVDCGDHYKALEGSHRIAAAATLGIVPDWQVIGWDDVIDPAGFDWCEAGNDPTPRRAGVFVESLYGDMRQAADFFFIN